MQPPIDEHTDRIDQKQRKKRCAGQNQRHTPHFVRSEHRGGNPKSCQQQKNLRNAPKNDQKQTISSFPIQRDSKKLFGELIQGLGQQIQLIVQTIMVITNEQAIFVYVLGIFHLAVQGMIKPAQHLIFSEVTSDDRTVIDVFFGQFGNQLLARKWSLLIDDQTEAEPTALTDFLLDGDMRKLGHDILETLGILASGSNKARQFLELLNTDRTTHFQRSHVIARQNKTERLFKRHIALGAADLVLTR